MKKLLVALLLAPLLAMASTPSEPNVNATTQGEERADVNVNAVIPANAVVILRSQLGSGTPGYTGLEPATHMGEGIYHAPQYMVAYPTAGTLWPRVIDVMCEQHDNVFICNGYNWLPEMGRGEYLFFRPRLAPPPVVREVKVPEPYPVYVEPKRKRE